jgi:antagonist of KipI
MDSTPLLRIERPGLLTTLQDQGRAGFQKDGIVAAGAMDTYASQVANVLAGNPRSESVLEITLLGPTMAVLHDVTVCLCGADLSARTDEGPLPLWRSVRIRAGQTIRFGKPRSGARAYLAVAGGFDVPVVLGSKSTHVAGGLGGLDGRSLRTGDILRGWPDSAHETSGTALADAAIPSYLSSTVVRVILGPQLTAFTPDAVATFLSSEYEITQQSNRMGYRLAGPPIAHASPSAADILSEAVPFGAIQVPAGGQPIILMADRPTTGGYAKIATVISVDLPLLAQMAPGARITFQAIELTEAHALAAAREQQMRMWEAAIRGTR